jgi:aspartyl-tRNA(Asn)/glutamyl-tRNA(Gln) amidotransferase subunit A
LPSEPGAEAVHAADLGVVEASAALQAGRLSAAELTEACLERIEARNGGPPTRDGGPQAINAWVRVYPEVARAQALEADRRRAREGDAAPALCGVPLAVKDLYAVRGLPLTASSDVLEGNIAERDAAVWTRLHGQGLVLLGHTHTHEFAAGGTTDQVGNPWSLERTVGGSSGGSAAALAAGMAPAALGTDTCGSLRIPSACCATSTIKPTRGRLPLEGIIPLGYSLDHPGPMARSVADCRLLLAAMDGAPSGSPPSSLPPVEPRVAARPLAGLRIALHPRQGEIELEPGVAAALERAAGACADLGASLVSAAAPARLDWDDLSAILLSEAWAYHRRHLGRRDRYRPAIAEFVAAASTFTDAQRYIEAQQRRAQLTAAWEAWMARERIDLVLEPTLPIRPRVRGEGYDPGHAGGAGDPMIALTALWDMTGMPVVAFPVVDDVGVSLIARREREDVAIQAAIDVQAAALPPPRLTERSR